MEQLNKDVESLYKELHTAGDKIGKIGEITDLEKLIAAKQILLGIAVLFGGAMALSLFPTKASHSLLEICKTILPPLATLIIVFYFKEKG